MGSSCSSCNRNDSCIRSFSRSSPVLIQGSCGGVAVGYTNDSSPAWYFDSSTWASLANLPAGVKVSKVSVVRYYALRTDTTNRHYNNFFTWTPETAGSGWLGTAQGGSTTSHTYGNGSTYNSFSITESWDASVSTKNNYVTNSRGTTDFNTYDSGPLRLAYSLAPWLLGQIMAIGLPMTQQNRSLPTL